MWTPRYGWVRPTDIAADGRRRAARRLPVDLRRGTTPCATPRIDRGWVVRTDHFSVQTNDSLQTAAELAVRLERLHSVWEQLFAEYYSHQGRPAQAARRRPPGRLPRAKPFQVVCYATRDEYNNTLRRKQAQIEKTIGIYFDDQRRSLLLCQ